MEIAMFFRNNNSSKRSASNIARGTTPVIENLEGRQLYSASWTEAAIPGSNAMALTVNGSSGTNTIMVGQANGNILVNVNGQTKTFSNVGSVAVNGNSGNDEILVARTVTIKSTINGGTGNDLLVATCSKPAMAMTISGTPPATRSCTAKEPPCVIPSAASSTQRM
jgi:hypothetical protein